MIKSHALSVASRDISKSRLTQSIVPCYKCPTTSEKAQPQIGND